MRTVKGAEVQGTTGEENVCRYNPNMPHARHFDINSDRLVLVGSPSGGHPSVSTAL